MQRHVGGQHARLEASRECLGTLLARSLLLGGRNGSLKSQGSQQTLLNPGLWALSDVQPNLLELEALETDNSRIGLPKKAWLDLGT